MRPLGKPEASENWPEQVQRYWVQAHEASKSEGWDAGSVMARSALQVPLRDQGAQGRTLKNEIDDLAKRGVLPPMMREWSEEVRLLGNDAAHPATTQVPALGFLGFLLTYLYDLPKQISDFRQRRASSPRSVLGGHSTPAQHYVSRAQRDRAPSRPRSVSSTMSLADFLVHSLVKLVTGSRGVWGVISRLTRVHRRWYQAILE